ncbi:MAG TPA: serine/threonine protein kinase, partial [Pseudomonas sp.]|nr:serine/threonine protein kinase [Pseudomonas sp.]
GFTLFPYTTLFRSAAPELIDGGALSMATDIYAVACVIYELCHGQHPYRRLSAKQAQGMSLALAAPTGMPAPVWKVLKRGLAFDVARRSDSLAPLLAAFRANPASPRFGRWFGRRA